MRGFVLAPLALILAVRMPDAPAQAMTVGEANAKFVDQTRISFSPGHGTQVSYMRPDGTVFLWYPGNRVVVRGRWLIESRAKSAYLCFQYGADTYNPVTNQSGTSWSCQQAGVFARITVDRVRGDLFGLANRQAVPFLLTPERTIIAELKQRARP